MTREDFRRALAFLGLWLAFSIAVLMAFNSPVAAQTGTYNATAPVLTNGQRTDLQVAADGSLKVTSAASGATADQVQGNVASGATDSGNPVKVGAVHNTTQPILTNGQRGDLQLGSRGSLRVELFDASGTTSLLMAPANADDQVAGAGARLGQMFAYDGTTIDRVRGDTNGIAVQPALSANYWSYAAAASGIVSSTADVVVKAAAGAGVRNYICSLDISHDTLSAVSEIVVKDGATVLWRGKLQTAAGSGAGAGASPGQFYPCLKGTANTAVNVAMISSVTGGVFVNLTGYTGS